MSTVPISGDAIAATDAGGKAQALAAAARAGLAVPPWVVLHPLACRGPAARLTGTDGRLSPELVETLQRIAAASDTFAVRSSGQDEDGSRHSFAGQFETFLNVPWSEVPARVEEVWQSGRNERVLAYSRERGLDRQPSPPAAIVQRMVRARVAGVAFSADPVTGRTGISIVSAVRGLGTALVSGESDADTWHVDRGGAIVQRSVFPKRTMHTADAAKGAGVATVPVPASDVWQPALTDGEIAAVARLARDAARCFGKPQDIEWAFEGDTLWLLQSRPITSLARLADPDGSPVVWDNSNIVESYNGVTTPLTFSFASDVYAHVYRQFCRLVHVPEEVVASRDDAFQNMLGLIQGRLYYNLLNWYRVLALLPGYALNRSYMEQMMGVREALPPGLADAIGVQASRNCLRDAARVARSAAGLAAAHVSIARRNEAFRKRLDDALAEPVPRLHEMRPDELAAHYRELRRRLLLSWDAPLVNDFFAMVFYGLLRAVCARWCGDGLGTLQNDLIAGEGGLVSAEPALRIEQLARMALRSATLLRELQEGTAATIGPAMENVPEFRPALQAYLEKFGERTVNELELESVTLHDDPLPLLRSIGAAAGRLGSAEGESMPAAPPPEPAGDRLRAEARRTVAMALAGHPLRRAIFAWILRNARARVRDRENLRLERTRLFGRVRRVFVELGRRLHQMDVLDAPEDVFYLQTDEVLAFVDGRAVTTNLRALAALRREEFSGYRSMPAPAPRFETRGAVYCGHDFRSAGAGRPAEETGARRGLGCGPGRVRGPVRVVTDPRTADLKKPAILVAEHTDPGWVLVFPSALGVLVERGSLLSHAAIVARELGIPAVVSVPGLTSWLNDGDWVEFDGTTGVIRRVTPAGGEAVRA